MDTGRSGSARRRWIIVLKRVFELEPAERRTVARAFVALGWMSFALRLRGFRRLFTAIEQTKSAVMPSGEDLRRARSYARWIGAASRHHFVRANCLERSLVLHRWLRREGLPSVLRIGVRTDDGKLIAHAWVEVAGTPLGDRPDALELFRTFDGLAAAALVAPNRRAFDVPRALER
jgi:hypothetical protein